MTRPATPFFITGTGRSGSTFLYHLLRAHPLVAITNEARIIDALWLAYQAVAVPYGESIPESGLVGLIHPSTQPLMGDVFRGHLMTMLEEYYRRKFGAGFTHFGDKLPDHCAVGMAAEWSGDVRVMMMVRDPRDVVCSFQSVQKRPVPVGPREVLLRRSSVRDLAVIWRDTYEYLLAKVPHIHHVSYVKLVTKPAETTRAVLDYLGLGWDDAISKVIATDDTILTHGTTPTAAASMGRWRRDLAVSDAQVVVDLCGPMMARLGLAV